MARRLFTSHAQAALDAEKQGILLGGSFAHLSSRIAVDNATDLAVKAFAMLERSEQEAVAVAFGAAPSDQLKPDHGAMLEQSTAAPAGNEFDNQYIDGQMTGHEQVRALHAAYAENSSDPKA